MLLTERAAVRLATITANAAAAAGGLAGAWAAGFGPWVLLVAPLTGTLGWFAGFTAGRASARRLARAGYAPSGRPLYRLEHLPPDEVSAGGKARSLSRLIRAGNPVPAGLVLLPRAFDGDRVTSPVGDELRAELARFPAGRTFAVRSSASVEDSAEASFAGAFDSVVDVAADDLEAAIAQVRASARAVRVGAYSEAVAADRADLAVVVQTMVDADLAGVLFTVHPLTGALDQMLGSLVHGAGEALVSGADTGQQFTLARPSGAYTGPDELRPFAQALHDEAHRIETTFDGVPQDIEWVIAGGRLSIVQARPITTLNPWNPRTTERNDSLAGTCLWSATNLSEANPVPQTPLTISLTRYQQANGGPSMALRGRELAGSIGGRPYANLTVQITARRGKGGKQDPREVYRKLAGWWGALPENVPVPLLPMTPDDWQRAGPPLLGSVVRMQAVRFGLPRFLREHARRCDELMAQVRNCSAPAELLRLWNDEVLGFGIDSFWAVIASGSDSAAGVEQQIRDRYGADVAAGLMSNLSGFAGDLASMGPAVGLGEVLAGRMSRDEYLRRFGHRGVNEAELAWPRPCEDPGWLDRMLEGATDSATLRARRVHQQQAFDQALDAVRARELGQVRRLERRLTKVARRAALREAVRSEGVRTIGVTRAWALRCGDLLGIGDDVFLLTVEELLASLAGDLGAFPLFEQRRDTLRRYRALPALPAAIVGRFEPFVWAADPHRRTDVFVAGAEMATAAPSDEVVTGFAGAIGRVEGSVRRIDLFEDADQLRPGEILVTQLTNIGWTPLFPRAAGIVTDLGAPLSHAAIVARELGVPAVVGCGDATARLHTGDRVLLDGAAGTVRLLARAMEATADPGV